MINGVLLIDDNKASNFIHSKFLRETDNIDHVNAFEIGAQAIDFLKNITTYPELIFVDINMPTMDAWQFLDEYRLIERPEKNNAIIILLTTTISPQDEVKMKTYPEIKDIMYKPLDKAAIKLVCTNFFR